MAECACYIEPDPGNMTSIAWAKIVLCPTHAKAEAMAEALRELLADTAGGRASLHDEPQFMCSLRQSVADKARAALPEAPDATRGPDRHAVGCEKEAPWAWWCVPECPVLAAPGDAECRPIEEMPS